jgi:hypothetical protein
MSGRQTGRQTMTTCSSCGTSIPTEQLTKFEEAVDVLAGKDGDTHSDMTRVLASAMAGTMSAWKCNVCGAWLCNPCVQKAGLTPARHDKCQGIFLGPNDWAASSLPRKKWWEFWK